MECDNFKGTRIIDAESASPNRRSARKAGGGSPRSKESAIANWMFRRSQRLNVFNPGGLFRWLLVNKRFDFITLADEDAAIERLRAMRQRRHQRVGACGAYPTFMLQPVTRSPERKAEEVRGMRLEA